MSCSVGIVHVRALETRLRAAVRAEVSERPFAVTRPMVEYRLGPRSWSPAVRLTAAGFAIVAVVGVAALGVAPRIAPNVGGPPTQAPDLGSDPCALLSIDDVRLLTGSDVTDTRRLGADVMNDPHPVQRCILDTDGPYGRISLAVDADGGDDFARWRDANRGADLTALAGLGDEAYLYSGAMVSIRVGSAYFEISSQHDPANSSAGTDMAELGRAVLLNLGAVAAEAPWAPAVSSAPIEAGGQTCSVTIPSPPFVAPAPYPAFPPDEGRAWVGTPELWTMVDRNGEVENEGDVSFPIGLKTFWWSSNWGGMAAEPQPALTVVATRLDAYGSVTTGDATNAASASLGGQAMLVGIELPSSGCWQLTGKYRGAELSYVVLVEQARGGS